MNTWQRIEAKARSSQEQALAAFMARKIEIDAMLARFTALSNEHFDTSPEEVDWGHVGTLGHYASLLRQITDMALKEGEHAEQVPAAPGQPRATRVAGARARRTARVAVAIEEPTMTDLSKTQLATILSALDGERRSPANRDAAMKAIGKSAEQLGLGAEAVLMAASGLLDGRLDAATWRAGLVEPPAPTTEPPATGRDGAAEPSRPRSREGTKEAMLIAMLRRPEGATIAQVIEATGWQPHTVRGAISGALKRKRGLEVTSAKSDSGERVYKIGSN
jgi:hypothetical protein